MKDGRECARRYIVNTLLYAIDVCANARGCFHLHPARELARILSVRSLGLGWHRNFGDAVKMGMQGPHFPGKMGIPS